MAHTPPIDDNYIDEVIKSTGPYNEALNKTQGVKLRELIKKLRDYFEQEIQQGFNEQTFANIAERDAYEVSALPFQAFVLDDGDGNWALYRATSTGIGAAYVKISDPDLLNAVMSSSAIKAAYESNADTNAFTDADREKLASLPNDGFPLILDQNSRLLYDKRTTGTDDQFNSTFMGFDAGRQASYASGSNFFGACAGQDASNSRDSNFFGIDAGRDATGASYSNFFGTMAGYAATDASCSNFFGIGTGSYATGAASSNFIGDGAGRYATGAANSNLFGTRVGMAFKGNIIGSNNIIIGTDISLPNGTSNAINIGGVLFGTGTHAISNSGPSIIPANGKIGINKVTPTSALDVAGILEYADNAAALAAGLTAGAFYRTGDVLKIVH